MKQPPRGIPRLFGFILAVSACSGTGSTEGDSEVNAACVSGAQGCACRAEDGTCDPGLACNAGVCGTMGVGGTPGTGGAPAATCGNAVIEAGETCDPPGTCPASCDDGNTCTTDQLTGSTQSCNVACSHGTISICVSGDGCCPSGCATSNDSDCSSATGGSGGATGGTGGTTGGTGGTTGGSGGSSTSACWTGATVTWTATDYISRKWARWPIPTTPSAGLPHPMSYTQTADGVLDNVTGLTWQQTTSPTGSTWASALAYCTGLGQGWSLPTRIELTTIIDHGRSGSKIDTSVFTFGASAGWTWASTPWVVNERRGLTGSAALSWFVNFAVGDTHGSLSQTNSDGRSRCVRIQPTLTLPADHYTVANGEVHDNYTCLTWQQDGSGTTPSLTRDQAIQYCQNLPLNGGQWRLPTINELASIVDDVPSGDVSPAIDHAAFPNTSPNAKYWSTSGYNNPPTSYFTLNFEDGYTEHPDATTLGNARCVR